MVFGQLNNYLERKKYELIYNAKNQYILQVYLNVNTRIDINTKITCKCTNKTFFSFCSEKSFRIKIQKIQRCQREKLYI